ncbi:hypothetical protein ACS0PU_002351 [Formica fusca]
MSLGVVARSRWCHSVVVVTRVSRSSSSSSSAGVDVVVVGCARDRTGKEEMVSSPDRTEVESDYCSSLSSVYPNANVARGAAVVVAAAAAAVVVASSAYSVVDVVITAIVAAVATVAVVVGTASPDTATTAVFDASTMVVRAANEASIATV